MAGQQVFAVSPADRYAFGSVPPGQGGERQTFIDNEAGTHAFHLCASAVLLLESHLRSLSECTHRYDAHTAAHIKCKRNVINDNSVQDSGSVLNTDFQQIQIRFSKYFKKYFICKKKKKKYF